MSEIHIIQPKKLQKSMDKNTAIMVLLFIWQFPQILVGWIVSLFYKVDNKVVYKDKTIRVCKRFPGGISLGNTIIVSRYPNSKETWSTVKHEYGHTIQSKWLGWFYLFVIGIPSLLWALIHKPSMGSYYNFYTERWADRLGNVQR